MRRTARVFRGSVLAGLLLTLMPSAQAEQFRRLGAWDVHYVVIRTSFLKPEIAARNNIVRGRDRALLNLSVLGRDGQPVAAEVTGTVRNLLEQVQPLEFQTVREGSAIYYLAEVRHTDRETLRFAIDIVPPDGIPQQLRFQQQLYEDGR
ncbi:MAG: DUF4426 domain-containing protein [Gammaproteobacteria bacterium]